jgi:hypothetical protein
VRIGHMVFVPYGITTNERESMQKRCFLRTVPTRCFARRNQQDDGVQSRPIGNHLERVLTDVFERSIGWLIAFLAPNLRDPAWRGHMSDISGQIAEEADANLALANLIRDRRGDPELTAWEEDFLRT